jgi:hypothetical protein
MPCQVTGRLRHVLENAQRRNGRHGPWHPPLRLERRPWTGDTDPNAAPRRPSSSVDGAGVVMFRSLMPRAQKERELLKQPTTSRPHTQAGEGEGGRGVLENNPLRDGDLQQHSCDVLG